MMDWDTDLLVRPAVPQDPPSDQAEVSEVVALMFPDVHGSLRGKAYSRDRFLAGHKRGFVPVPDFILMVDPTSTAHDPPDPRLTRAFGDIHLRPEIDTLRKLNWRPGWQICLGTPLWADGEPCDLAPRVVLREVVDRLAKLGLRAQAAFEYEVVLRDEDGAAPFSQVSYTYDGVARAQPLIDAFRRACADLGIEIELVHTEDGPGGVLEINVASKPAIEAADDALLLRTCFRDLARQHGLNASFLAKLVQGADGCGGHMHISLWELEGAQNAFTTGDPNAWGVCPAMSAGIAGLLTYMRAFACFYLPTLNSYKRLVPGHSAPLNLTWGVDNRLAAVRAITAVEDDAVRLEHRVPGADANPYLALAAAIGSMVLGLEQELGPPPPADGRDTISDPALAAPLPSTLESALALCELEPGVADVIGEAFVKYYLATRRWELEAWQGAVSDWERERGSHVV